MNVKHLAKLAHFLEKIILLLKFYFIISFLYIFPILPFLYISVILYPFCNRDFWFFKKPSLLPSIWSWQLATLSKICYFIHFIFTPKKGYTYDKKQLNKVSSRRN